MPWLCFGAMGVSDPPVRVFRDKHVIFIDVAGMRMCADNVDIYERDLPSMIIIVGFHSCCSFRFEHTYTRPRMECSDKKQVSRLQAGLSDRALNPAHMATTIIALLYTVCIAQFRFYTFMYDNKSKSHHISVSSSGLT